MFQSHTDTCGSAPRRGKSRALELPQADCSSPVQQPWHLGTAFNSSIKIPLGSFSCWNLKEAVTQSRVRYIPKCHQTSFPREFLGAELVLTTGPALPSSPFTPSSPACPCGDMGAQKKPLTTMSFTSVGTWSILSHIPCSAGQDSTGNQVGVNRIQQQEQVFHEALLDAGKGLILGV